MDSDINIRFMGLTLAGGEDYKVPCPRVPVAGDVVEWPDDRGRWRVHRVEFRYLDGLAFEPDVWVLCEQLSG